MSISSFAGSLCGDGGSVRDEYDIFEKLPDNSFVWRACVPGRYNTECKLRELAETSNNQFYILNLAAGDTLPQIVKVKMPDPIRMPGPLQAIKGLKKNIA
jgi:hypothetical protein